LDLPDEPLPDELGSSTSPDGPLPSSWPTFANREGDSGGKNQQQPMRFLRNITPVPHSFLLLSKYASFQVYCDTAQDKQCWLSDLNRARSELRDQKSALLFRSDVSPIKLSAPPPTPTTIPPTKSAAAKINDGDDDDQQTEGRPDTASAGYQSPPEEDSFCAPVWIPDEAALDCMVCQQPFSLFRRRHHCRKCGIVCCADCSSRTFIVPSKTTVRIERACDPCYFQMFKMELSAAEAAIGGTQKTIPEDDSEESTLSDNRQRRGGKLEEELKLSTPPIAIQGEFVMPDRSRVRSVTKSLLVESAILSSSPPSQRRRWSERLLLAGNVLSNNTDRSTTGDRQRANSMFFFSTSASNNRVSSVTAECELCASQFGLLRRRYECEQCGRKVCGYCAPRIWSHHKCDLCLYSFDIGRGNSGGGFCNSGEDKRRQRAASKLSTHTNALFGMSPNSRLKRPRLGMAVRCSAGNLYGDSGSRFSHLGIAAELHQRHQHQQLEQQHRSSTAF
jgi:hypothetical protein